MKNKKLPFYVKENKAERKARLKFQRENGVDLTTKVVKSTKKYSRKREKVKFLRSDFA